MMTTLRRTTSTPDLMATQTSTVNEMSKEDPSVKLRRTRRCAGCHETHDHHSWGQPGPHCQGRDEESDTDVEDNPNNDDEDQESVTSINGAAFGLPMDPSMPQASSFGAQDDTERHTLERKLRHLALEERRLTELDSLRRKVADKEASLMEMRQRQQQAGRWMAELQLDQDKEFLLDGIINGFELIPADSPLSPAEMDNYSSSTKPEARDKVEQTLREEIAEGNYNITPTKPTIVSAISAVPKADSQELRLIHDCSMPAGNVPPSASSSNLLASSIGLVVWCTGDALFYVVF
eukprot:Seg199.7 transcript_id=Seg199.7/GoldUCD/mRNA.D3Y31 product="hypothetical protein" protein_id=Seg199.7/GoldUCD/D3Y31